MGFFANSAETRELHKNDKLRTRYYRNGIKQIKSVFEKICSEEDMQLQQYDERWGDIYICAYGFEVFVTVSQISPIESGIDLKVNYFSTFGFNRPEKKIIHLYERLDKMLIFKGTMLHVN